MPSNCQLLATINNASTVQYSDGSEVGSSLVWGDITSTQGDSPKYLSVVPVAAASQYFRFIFSQATKIAGVYFESINGAQLSGVLRDTNGLQVGSFSQVGDVLLVRSGGVASDEFILEVIGGTSAYTLSKPVLIGYDIAHAANLEYEWADQFKPWSGVEFFETKTSQYAHDTHQKVSRQIQFTVIGYEDFNLMMNFLRHFDTRPLLFIGYDEAEGDQYVFGVAEKASAGRKSIDNGQISIKINAMHKRYASNVLPEWL